MRRCGTFRLVSKLIWENWLFTLRMSIRAQGERGGKGMQAPIQAEVIGYLGAKYK